MARGKGGASRGKARGSTLHAKQSKPASNILDFRPPGSSNSNGASKKLSLEEEARNTERGPNFWSSENKLRFSKVNFISAGAIDPAEAEASETNNTDEAVRATPNPEAAFAVLNLGEGTGSSSHDQPASTTPAISTASHKAALCAVAAAPPEAENPTAMASFFVDVKGSGSPVHTGIPPPTIRPPSPTPSDSSVEVIVFTGRNKAENKPSRPVFVREADLTISASRSEQSSNRTTKPSEAESTLTSTSKHGSVRVIEDSFLTVAAAVESTSTPDESSGAPATPKRREPRARKRAGRRAQAKRADVAGDALLADYIANMQDASLDEDDEPAGLFTARDLGPTASEERTGEPRNAWDSPALEDLDDISTSDEVLGAIEHILSKRERPQGRQYLIVWEGYTMDDAKWIPSSSLTMVGAAELIQRFEGEEKLVPQISDDTSDSSDEDLDEESGGESDDAGEDERDEADLIQRKIERMTDEKIARLLAKQEELGMGSDQLMIFDDTDGYEDDGDLVDAVSVRKGKAKAAPLRKTRASGKKRLRGDAPSAAALADAYDGFDVMDWERTSLQKKAKGRQGGLPFDVSDSELEAVLQASWDGDRAKKKARKQEREQLRAQGLLGKKNASKPNLKLKYAEGMTLDHMKDEIRSFLLSSGDTLALPPMDKNDRKIVHELANAFNLKSKSVGDAKNRFPTIYKTARTRKYDEDTLEEIDRRLRSRRFLPRLDKRAKRRPTGGKRAFGGSGNAAAGYRDGEVVGAAAPELGVENRGRAMLEKLGWSSGTALGALDNKGILQPVAHVVKISKAGLG